MRGFRRLLAAVCLAMMTAGVLPAGAAPATERVIVRLMAGSGPTRDVASKLMAENGGALGPVYGRVLKGFAATVPSARVAALRNHRKVAAVVPDAPVEVAEAPNGVLRAGAHRIPGTRIGTGAAVDVDIAILDTGVNTHPDLTIAGGVNCLGDTGCTTGGYTDNHGHGTHVAGTAAAKDNGIGVVGTAPGARIWAVKVLPDSGSGTMSAFIAGLDWVAAKGTIEVANASLGSAYWAMIDTAVQRTTEAGVVVVAAAGNDSVDAATKSPAAAPNAITVSAFGDTDGAPGGFGGLSDDTFASFSNYGAVVDIAAPGVAIYSTDRSGGYSYKQGTSMAAPHVAGAAAVYIADNGIAASAGRWQTVLNGLRGEWAGGQTSSCGFSGGRSDEPVLMMGGCGGGDTVPPTPVVVTPTGGDARVSLEWTASADSSGIGAYRLYRAKGTRDGLALIATLTAETRTYLDTAVLNKTLYRYRVVAVDTAGNSSSSAVISVTPADFIPPPDTSVQSAVGTDRAVRLHWLAVVDPGLKGYEVWRAVPGMPFAKRVTTVAKVTTYLDKSLINGAQYRYFVRTIDKAGNRAAASPVVAVIPVDDAAPVVARPGAVVGDGKLTIKWSAAKDSTGVASYRLYRAVGEEPFGAPVILGPESLTYVHTGLTNYTVYRYALSAVDTLGHVSALSVPKLAAPKDLTGPAAVSLSGSVTGTSASLSWTAATDPSGIGGYRIQRAVGTGSYRTVTTIKVAAPRTFQQVGLLPGSYTYIVRPVDTKGNVGAPSNTVIGSVS